MSTIHIEYGSYVHAVGELEMSFRRSALMTDAQTPYAERIEIDLVGELIGTSVSDINSKVAALIAGYAYNGYDFKVKDDSGTLLRLSIASSGTLGGVRIIRPPSFPSNKDGAYATFMPYQISLQADVPVTNPETVLVSFQESLSFSGGGPVYEYLETRIGPPQRQRVTDQSVYMATQEGSAVGLYNIPTIPSPLWPANQVRQRAVNATGGKLVGSGANRKYMFKGVRWRYEFKSATPLLGDPHDWGNE